MHSFLGPVSTRAAAAWLMAALLLSVPLAVSACAPAEEPEEPAAPAEPEPILLDAALLGDPTRPEADRAEDEGRRAIDVYNFLGIQAGMTVADMWPGGGYNTHLLSLATGDEGNVVSILDFYADFNDGAFVTQLEQRIEDASLTNVEVVNTLADVAPDSIEAMVAVRNYHDAPTPRDELVAQFFAAMKPGGILGIVELATPHEGFHEETHRLNQQVVIDELTAGGFELVGSSDILSNPDDDHSTTGFEEELGRHRADRYLLKFRKPQM